MMHKYLFVIGFILLGKFAYADIVAGVNSYTYFENDQPYVELNIHVVGGSLTPRLIGDNQQQGEVIVQVFFIEKNDTILRDIFELKSPIGTNVQDFIHLTRYKLEPSTLTLGLQLTDQLNIENQFSFQKEINIPSYSDQVLSSKTKLLGSLTKTDNHQHPLAKYGYIMEPASFHFYHKEMNQLYGYKEIYNLDQTNYDSIQLDIKIVEDNTKTKVIKSKSSLLTPQAKSILIEGFSIKDLPSGNYFYIIDIHGDDQEILRDTVAFQRSNPALDTRLIAEKAGGFEDSFIEKLTNAELDYSLKGLAPRLEPKDRAVVTRLLLDEGNERAKRYFLYNYWVNYDPMQTEQTFNQYQKIIEAVDKKFYSAYGRGFETDRGYVFLRYGKPNNVITVEDEPSAPPYEIWFYDRVERTGQSNVKFLFYNPNLGAYHYELLHSTCRGEVQNKQWEVELYSAVPNEIEGNRVDATTVKDNYNRRAREYFEDQN